MKGVPDMFGTHFSVDSSILFFPVFQNWIFIQQIYCDTRELGSYGGLPEFLIESQILTHSNADW
jgi:hypothetical protein